MVRLGTDDATIVADLNDLLQLDHDALGAYQIAYDALDNPLHKEQIRRFRADHERHIAELVPLIRARGGIPLEISHLSTGVLKLGAQQAGRLGGDAGVLLSFKANERQVRDKYRRAAERWAGEEGVADVIRRAADDEQRHYMWALETLEDLGVGADTSIGKVEKAVEVGHARMADAAEGATKGAMTMADSLRRAVQKNPVGAAAIAVGVGLAAVALGTTRRR